eukprot:TRINITY_DN73530_c0_g1_i1.p1 TRINITY_DN73530_c0_g1~~TRINITY_DN73530_c0_g1_i1.p1  ORF type:complete len:1421 (+),score=227.21 TRINITY_DN73530_c0_g1_i1:97-4359(+)
MFADGDTSRQHVDTEETMSRDVRPLSLLQRRRAEVVPALPKSLCQLRQSSRPRFEEVADQTRVSHFPQFERLLPITLQKNCDGSAGGTESNVGGSGNSSAPSSARVPPESSASTAASFGSLPGGQSPVSASRRIASGAATTVETEGSPGALRVGIVFAAEFRSLPSAPTNILAGLAAYLDAIVPGSQLFGFPGGPVGLLEGWCRELTRKEIIDSLNQGTWDILSCGSCSDGSFHPSARKAEARRAMEVCDAEKLNGLVIVGGRRDLSWAAAISTCFEEEGSPTCVIGIPNSKSLDLYVPRYVCLTLGFDSARRMISELGGNIAIDALSSDKYWHFLRGGEDALTVEVGLQLRATCAFTSAWGWQQVSSKEDVSNGGTLGESGEADVGNSETSAERGGKQPTLMDAVKYIQHIIERRQKTGYRSGIVLLSSSLIATLPEMDALKQELLRITAATESGPKGKPPSFKDIEAQIENSSARELFKRLPRVVQMSLMQKRCCDGKPLLPKDLEPERILGRFVQQELKNSLSKADRATEGYSCSRFAPRFHAIEMMSCAPLPTVFDCSFGYTLGHTAGALLCEKRNFYVASCGNMHRPVAEWEPCAVPFSFLYGTPGVENSESGREPVDPVRSLGGIPSIGVAQRKVFKAFQDFQRIWANFNQFSSPGPVQFENDGVSDVEPLKERPFTLLAEYFSIEELKRMIQPERDLPPPLTLCDRPLIVRDVRVAENLSALEQRLLAYKPKMPDYLRKHIRIENEPITPQACDDNEAMLKAFPLTHENRSALRLLPSNPLEQRDVTNSGVTSSGLNSENDAACTSLNCSRKEGSPVQRVESMRPLRVGLAFVTFQAPGFHNIAAGLFDMLATLEQPLEIVGFVGGNGGLINNITVRITKEIIDQYRNLGGEDMICQFGSYPSLAGHLQDVMKTIKRQNLDGLVLAGHLSSLVDSAAVAEACAEERLSTRVVGVPISWDCNIPFVQQSVGYDTVARTLSSFVGNLGSLAKASEDTWVFIRTVGDSWSHLAVQCALKTCVNVVLLSGDELLGQSLTSIVKHLCDLIVSRHEKGLDYGTVLIPWGFVTDVTELRLLFTEIMEIMKNEMYETGWDSIHKIASKLKQSSAAIFNSAPRDVQYEICFGARERGSNKMDLGNVSSERFLLRFVEDELKRRQRLGLVEDFFNGATYSILYQARSAAPTKFDCDLAYTLGWAAGILVHQGRSGQLVHASGLEHDINLWSVRGIPLTCLLNAEFDVDTGEHKIMPAVLQLLKKRGVPSPIKSLPCEEERIGLYEGPVQLLGPLASEPELLARWFLEVMPSVDPTEELNEIAHLCEELQSTMLGAKVESTLMAVNSLLSNALTAIDSYKSLSDAATNRSQSLADIPLEQSPLTCRMRRMQVRGMERRSTVKPSRISPRLHSTTNPQARGSVVL